MGYWENPFQYHILCCLCFLKDNLVPRVSHLAAQAREERPWLGLVTCLPESGRWQLNHWREGRPSINFVQTEPTGVRNMLSPKYTRFHVLPRYVVLRQCPTVIFCKRRKKLIHRLITEIKVAVGCVVQLRTLSIVKISSRSQMKNCSQRLRRCMEELYLGMN